MESSLFEEAMLYYSIRDQQLWRVSAAVRESKASRVVTERCEAGWGGEEKKKRRTQW